MLSSPIVKQNTKNAANLISEEGSHRIDVSKESLQE